MNTKPHAVTDTSGRAIRCFMSAGQVSDDTGAAARLGDLPAAHWLLAPSHGLCPNRCRAADRGYDAGWFRKASQGQGDQGLHSRPQGAQALRDIRQAPLQAAQPPSQACKHALPCNRSRSCLAGSGTGDAWQPATTDAQRSSSPQSRWPLPCCSGYESCA